MDYDKTYTVTGFSSTNEIPPININDMVIFDTETKCEEFNKYFVEPSSLNLLNEPELDFENILRHPASELKEDVIDQIKTLKTKKAYGCDGISPHFLKIDSDNLVNSLVQIFNFSLQNGTFPSEWKKASVLPLHKKESRNLLKNYRPVSLILSILSKVFEKVVYKYVYNHFLDNYIISEKQHGFLRKHSTVTQLIELHNNICFENSNNSKETRLIFLDISKAFDRVWHKGLLFKLSRTGLSLPILRWFENYLSNRYQCVNIKGISFTWLPISSGVQQGSVLGPLLFLIFINDIIDVVKYCNINLFADDTCVYYSYAKREEGAKLINEDLENILKWSKHWLINFNTDKTKTMLISNKKHKSNNNDLILDNKKIDEVKTHKHLGIILSNNLSWNEHISTICLQAKKRIDIMRTLKYNLDRNSLERFYFGFIRPILEYGRVLFAGGTLRDLSKIDTIEKEAMRICTGATAKCNLQLLNIEAKWELLEERRKNQVLIMLYRIINGDAPKSLVNILDNLINVENDNQYQLRHRNNLKKPFCKCKFYEYSFFPFAISVWNQLPPEIKLEPTLSKFKSCIQKKYKPNKLFHFGKRKLSIMQARIRMGCSGLNSHLTLMLHVKNNSSCLCGFNIETPKHYFLNCPLYAGPRQKLLRLFQT